MRRLHLHLMPLPFLQSHTVSMQASASRWVMSLGVLKWNGSCITALFKFVGSRQILNWPCPWLSLFSTRTKLLIHSVASFTGSRTPACSIWLISFWNASLRWIGYWGLYSARICRDVI